MAASLGLGRTQTDPSDPTIERDQFSPVIKVVAKGGERSEGSDSQIYGLYGAIDKKSGATTTYVQWGEVYGSTDWRFYVRASNDKAQPLSMKEVQRNVGRCFSTGRCVYTEVYNIMIPAADLKSGATEGASFKLYAKNGEQRIVKLPAELISKFNEKMAEAQRDRKGS